MKKRLQSQEGMKKKRAEEKKKLREREELNITTREQEAEEEASRARRNRFLGLYAYGSIEHRVVYALVEGWEDKDALAEKLGTTRKVIARVERDLRRGGFAREEVVRYRPPPGVIDGFKYQRRAANAPDEDCPF